MGGYIDVIGVGKVFWIEGDCLIGREGVVVIFIINF